MIVDSPIRSPEEETRHPLERPPMGNKRVYETFDAALARFRLMPEQLCENPFIVEFIGRRSLAAAAVLIAAPVYRASFPGVLKNLLHIVPVEALQGKPVGIVAMGGSAHHYRHRRLSYRSGFP